MEGAFDPHAIESELYAQWERSGGFAPSGNGTPYCIMIPPPNITGRLHMGHAFQQTIMDALIRYRRMRGDRTLWQVGTDHAGISTQMVVQRQLEAAGVARESLTREQFVDRVWQWRETTGRDIERQMRRMGSSVDWSRNRFTMDAGFSDAVREVFVQLHERGYIYRGERLVNWDPVLKTGISDLEVENEEEAGHLYHVRYPLAGGARTGDGADHLIVATTRPETMLGDTAVAVHPDDERYQGLVGARVLLPLVNREIPIIADAYVDREFGTGCVKITPAHDFNDYEIGTRHDLPRINILTPDARINDNAPERFRGLDRERARAAVLAELAAAGLLARVDDHRLPIPRGDRTGAIIEPLLSTQWFVRMAPLAAPAVAAVRDGRVQFVPRQYENLYFAWMRDIKDWNISRQLWWGHRIPAWHAADGSVYVGRDEAAVRARHQLADDVALVQDSDVLETWFSSALWTFGTLGWPEKTSELAHFHPTNVLVTGHDIIFFWVARMIMMTLEFTGEVPFRKVYMHGLVRDAEGQKMSKTKGNGLDPLDLVDGITLDALIAKRTEGLMQPQLAERIERATRREFPDGLASYGADALRFNFCAMASSGRDIRLDLSRIGGYRNFCNKLWNATRYVLANVDRAGLAGPVELGPTERWITSRLQRLIADVEQHFENFRFDLLANALYEFIWHEYCDWYLELAKPLLRDESLSAARRRGTRVTLVEVLETALRVLHPVTPFLTEALWRRVQAAVGAAPPGPEPAMLMVQAYPRHDPTRIHADDEASIQWLQGVVMALRNLRGEQNVAPSREIDVLLSDGDAADRIHAETHARLVCTLARVRTLRWLAGNESAPVSATALAGGLRMLVPLAGLIDIDAECKRLDREVERKRGEIERLAAKLANGDFVARAPAAIVERERQKLADGQRALDTLVQQREALAPTRGA